MTDDMAVYIANLGRYNEGYLVGAWFTFPIDEEDVKEKIGLNEQYEEYAIHDTDNFPIEIGEYISIEELRETTYGMWKALSSVASLVCCASMTLCCCSRVNRRNDSAHLLRGLPSDSFPVPYFHGRIRRRHERHQVNWLFSSMIRIGALTIS